MLMLHEAKSCTKSWCLSNGGFENVLTGVYNGGPPWAWVGLLNEHGAGDFMNL